MAEELFVDDEFDVDGSGPRINVAVGFYHAVVDNAEEYGGPNKDSLVVKTRILAGTVEAERGNTHTEFIKMDGSKWPVRKMTALAIAAGLVTKEEVKAAQKEGKGVAVDWSLLTGRHICYEIDHSENNGKVYANVSYSNFWAPDAAAAKRIPKDEDALKIAATEQHDPFSNPPTAHAATDAGKPTEVADDENPFA